MFQLVSPVGNKARPNQFHNTRCNAGFGAGGQVEKAYTTARGERFINHRDAVGRHPCMAMFCQLGLQPARRSLLGGVRFETAFRQMAQKIAGRAARGGQRPANVRFRAEQVGDLRGDGGAVPGKVCRRAADQDQPAFRVVFPAGHDAGQRPPGFDDVVERCWVVVFRDQAKVEPAQRQAGLHADDSLSAKGAPRGQQCPVGFVARAYDEVRRG